jgi:hypothetical protein
MTAITIETLCKNAMKNKWVQHHIYAFIIQSKKERYSPKQVIDSFYRSCFPEDCTERMTQSPSWPPLARIDTYQNRHRNTPENSLPVLIQQ